MEKELSDEEFLQSLRDLLYDCEQLDLLSKVNKKIVVDMPKKEYNIKDKLGDINKNCR